MEQHSKLFETRISIARIMPWVLRIRSEQPIAAYPPIWAKSWPTISLRLFGQTEKTWRVYSEKGKQMKSIKGVFYIASVIIPIFLSGCAGTNAASMLSRRLDLASLNTRLETKTN